MSMPKKGTRLISVDGRRYRWRVSSVTQKTFGRYEDAQSRLVVLVEAYDDPACKLRAVSSGVLKASLSSWLMPVTPNGRFPHVTPRQVAVIIRQALEQGWLPDVKSAIFDLKNVELG